MELPLLYLITQTRLCILHALILRNLSPHTTPNFIKSQASRKSNYCGILCSRHLSPFVRDSLFAKERKETLKIMRMWGKKEGLTDKSHRRSCLRIGCQVKTKELSYWHEVMMYRRDLRSKHRCGITCQLMPSHSFVKLSQFC